MITICIPTLRRYDLLSNLVISAEAGSVVPDRYLICDNGGKLSYEYPKMEVYKPGENIGVAGSWNWLIRNSEDIRIVSNDDIVFHKNTVEEFVKNYDERFLLYPGYAPTQNIYSLFCISDYIYNLVGPFDESISPGYGYFEDNDYDWRLKEIRDQVGKSKLDYLGIPCGYEHIGSGTLKSFNLNEMNSHHEKFRKAQKNFKQKWGRLPE